MKKGAVFCIVLLVLISAGCIGEASDTTVTPETTTVAPRETEKVETESPLKTEASAPEEEKGIITDKLIYKDEGMTGEVRKNKLTKKAEVETILYFNDSEEWIDGFSEGEKITVIPAIVNMICNAFTRVYFNETGLKELQESGNITVENEQDIFLEGYSVTEASVIFKDKETSEKIAECTTTGPAWEDIAFKTYRDYPAEKSFMGVEIGIVD